MSLKGKVALVTGSTSGIGLGIARALGGAGADLMLNGFGDAAAIAQERANLAAEFGIRVGYSPADMSRPEQIAGMVAEAEKTLGAVDIMVSNAGIQHVANIEDFPAERWDAIIAINLSAVFHGMHAAIPGMKRRGWGRIINIASAHGLVASGQKVAYVAAKHGVVGMTKVAAIELANSGHHRQCDLSGLGADAAGAAPVGRAGRGGGHQRRAGGARVPGGEAADAAVLDAGGGRRAGGVPVLRCRRNDHRRAAVDRRRVGRAMTLAGSRNGGRWQARYKLIPAVACLPLCPAQCLSLGPAVSPGSGHR